MSLVIFGAQGYALGFFRALKVLYPRRYIHCFLVSKMGINPSVLGGIPVMELLSFALDMSSSEKDSTLVLIATPENVQPEIEETLESFGFHNHTRLTSERWAEMMKLYHARIGMFLPLSALPVGCTMPFLRIYIAKSHVDRPLRRPPVLPDYVFPIQVGRENAGCQIADIVDNTGDNISERNGNYSELTGLYWIWKNKLGGHSLNESADDWKGMGCQVIDGRKPYYGFGQYRRMLTFSSDDLLRLYDNGVDAVLPYPMPYEPNINAHHERYIKNSDWKALLKALAELEPEYADYFDVVLEQEYLYNYNVILARSSVLYDYCSWLFPILERIEQLTDSKMRSDRYIGYMAETLETLYFMKNSERNGGRLNIVHTLCSLYI